MQYKYDLFISYPSADRAWAERLYKDLLAQDGQLQIFLDRHSLRAGAKWEDQLNDALKSSRHFVVLWSNAAEGESWVGPEIQTFQAVASASANPNERLLFYIPLQGKRQNLESLQGFPQIRELDIYTKDEAQFGPELKEKVAAAWAVIVNKIAIGIRTDPNTDSVPLAVLTISRAEFDQIDRADQFVALNLDTLIAKIGTVTHTQLQERYRDHPLDWRPFGADRTVMNLFEEVLPQINARLMGARQRPIRWEPIDFAGVSGKDPNEVRRIVAQLNSQFSILAVDPIALYHRRISAIFRYFGPCLTNDKTVTVSFSPVTNDAPFHVSYSVRDLVNPILEAYFDPPVAVPSRFANFGMNIAQCEDIRRLVMFGLLQNRVSLVPAPGNAFTGAMGA